MLKMGNQNIEKRKKQQNIASLSDFRSQFPDCIDITNTHTQICDGEQEYTTEI